MMKNGYRMLSILCAFILLLSTEMAVMQQYIAGQDTINISISPFQHISTTMKAQVYDINGNLKQSVYKDNDLITDNLRTFLIGSLFTSYVTPSVMQTVSLTETGSAAKTIGVKLGQTTTVANYFSDSSSGTSNKGGYMAIGSGTNAPAVGDYELQTIYNSRVAVTTGYPTWDSASGNVTVTATIPITGSITITEGALYCQWIPSAGTTIFDFMMTRDTFTGIACVNTDTFVLTVIFRLSSEFSNNFGIYLKGIFTYVADGGAVINDYRDTGNTAVSTWTYYSSTGNAIVNHYLGSQNGGSASMAVGSSSTAVTRSQYVVLAQLGINTACNPAPYISSSTIKLIADVLLTSGGTVNEVAFYSELHTTWVTPYMLFRYVLPSPVAITAGHSVRVVATITL